MEIQYLKLMKENPVKPRNGYTNQGISLAEIQTLEQVYNSGNPFPKVLKELLFLAGDRCNVLDFGGLEGFFISQGWAIPTDAKEMQMTQIFIADSMTDEGVSMPNRPWFVIDIYNAEYPVFVFLDEGDDPNVYEFWITEPADPPIALGHNHIRKVKSPLSKHILIGVNSMLKGQNPF